MKALLPHRGKANTLNSKSHTFFAGTINIVHALTCPIYTK